MSTSSSLWQRFQAYHLCYEPLGFSLDISRMRFDDAFFDRMEPLSRKALAFQKTLEEGAIANPDEGRMVGHYWLRNPALAPTAEIRSEIETTRADIAAFAAEVHAGKIAAPSGLPFTDVLLVGIGGSALGPQFVTDALGSSADRMEIHFLDNTDPDGFDRLFAALSDRLAQTLVVVISKSGGTRETRNGMLEAEAAFSERGLDFPRHAVAITGDGSDLDRHAASQNWLRRFPMWDWVGGRTSVMSAVGLLPMALVGLDTDAFLAGAAAMDEATRNPEVAQNAALLLALMWYYAGDGRGKKDMVLLPYKDRLVLFSKYLQQLVMESLGKSHDLDGKEVHQGIAVYGNKGSTDQHAYVQQLRDGIANFFVTFIEVRKGRDGKGLEVDPGATSGDYLQGFLRGTRTALYEGGRDSITVSIEAVTPFTVGMLIALYERAVGFYATLVNINAYHQPGVEAGKKAASAVLELQARVRETLSAEPETAETIAARLGTDPEAVYHVLEHLAANTTEVTAHDPKARPGEERFSRS
ncbi:MAG TPA: glucose-6-phosphate isomerase [Chthoniobacteraceae bacterium]|nr:glucose-6-phosphate isomerase [Chthoniobacteraceae bacterium]